MTRTVAAVSPVTSVEKRIIIALDVDSADAAGNIVADLKGRVGAFKIGLQLYMAAGPAFVRELVESGEKVFLDLKFHDIPNTVANASIEAARLGVWMFNLHASGGREMMRQSVDAVENVCKAESLNKPLMIGVTALTSSDETVLSETGIKAPPSEQVLRLARLAAEAGMDGVVSSPQETLAIKAAFQDRDLLVVTPGIRSSNATPDDQRRVTTLGQAIAAGSDYVVIGRPITGSAHRVAAVEKMIEEAKEASND
jgi:orotidine-5'-phosphate decarboxylase